MPDDPKDECYESFKREMRNNDLHHGSSVIEYRQMFYIYWRGWNDCSSVIGLPQVNFTDREIHHIAIEAYEENK